MADSTIDHVLTETATSGSAIKLIVPPYRQVEAAELLGAARPRNNAAQHSNQFPFNGSPSKQSARIWLGLKLLVASGAIAAGTIAPAFVGAPLADAVLSVGLGAAATAASVQRYRQARVSSQGDKKAHELAERIRRADQTFDESIRGVTQELAAEFEKQTVEGVNHGPSNISRAKTTIAELPGPPGADSPDLPRTNVSHRMPAALQKLKS